MPRGDNLRGRAGVPLVERIDARLIEAPNGCLLWVGQLNVNGYGRVRGELPERKMLYVHREVYRLKIGPIPEGMQVDHQCHNDDETCVGGSSCLHRRCGNEMHLRLATNRSNQLASGRAWGVQIYLSGSCAAGHPRSAFGRRKLSNGTWDCRECGRLWKARQSGAQLQEPAAQSEGAGRRSAEARAGRAS